MKGWAILGYPFGIRNSEKAETLDIYNEEGELTALHRSCTVPASLSVRGHFLAHLRVIALWALLLTPAQAVTLWSDSGPTLAHNTGAGRDLLEGAVKRDDSSRDTLYFKFHVNPLSDTATEEYFAAFELYEGDAERLAMGNAPKAWAYSAFFSLNDTPEAGELAGYLDLRSSRPAPAGGGMSNYEVPVRGAERTVVFKVQYVAGGDDLVTVWLNPDLGPGANEVYQPETLTTRFNANASFDEIRLRHGGGGDGWTFSEMAIATSFSDFADTSSARPAGDKLNLASLAFNFQSWQREQGLSHRSLRALAQSGDGYLWIGSDEGLCRFDGARFVSFDQLNGSRVGAIRVLLNDSHGALWIGTADQGLFCLQQGKVTRFATNQGVPAGAINALAEDGQGRIWVGADTGLAARNSERFEPLAGTGPLNIRAITALFVDRKGNMWIGAPGAGVFKFGSGEWTRLTDPSIQELLEDPHCILVDQAGRLWIGAGDDLVLCRDGDQWRRYRLPRHSTHRYVTALAEESDGTVWAASVSEGLFQFKAGKLTPVNAGSGLSDNLVKSLFIDREGKLWVGTESGLNRLRRKNLIALSQEEGLGHGAVLGLAEVASGVIWATKPSDGLYRLEGSTFNRLNAAGIPPRDRQLGPLLVSRDGSCWVACSRGLVRFKDPQAVADESRLMGLTNLAILSLVEDFTGRIWAGTREGELWRLAQGKWQQQPGSWRNHGLTALVADPDGSMWIGTDGSGLYRLKAGLFSHFDKAAGLLSDSIRTLHLARDGTLWIGTAGGGLSGLSNGRIRTVSTREGLPDNSISQILEDDAGRLWLGTSLGIPCLSSREIKDLSAGRATTMHPRVFDRTDGLLAEECSAGAFPAGLAAKSGLLWFSTLKGVAVVNPRQHPIDASPPTVVLEEVLLDGSPLRHFQPHPTPAGAQKTAAPSERTLRIEPGRHRFEFQYTALSFDALDQLRFRYQLVGLDSGWVEAGPRRTAFYNYVPPGTYRFRVIACDREGRWNEPGANLALTVAPHFWQKGWVIALTVLGLLISVGSSVRLVEKRRSQRRLKRLEQERALERERRRIAQDLHDEMGAKLCRISFLSEHARRAEGTPAEVQQQIDSISEASREVLHSLDEIVWAVNPKNDSLEHLVSYIGQYAHDYFQMTGIECELDISAQLPPYSLSSQVRHHLFLAAHEAFTNILKHSTASHARITMNCHNGKFELTAFDNGRGFTAGVENPLPRGANDAGNGLRNMTERLADIGGRCEIRSSPGRGTTIHFILPLNGLHK